MAISKDSKKVKISYPCNWKYKIVIESSNKISTIIDSMLEKREYSSQKSKKSKSAKYQSYNLEILVFNEEERLYFFDEFKKHCDIKFVL